MAKKKVSKKKPAKKKATPKKRPVTKKKPAKAKPTKKKVVKKKQAPKTKPNKTSGSVKKTPKKTPTQKTKSVKKSSGSIKSVKAYTNGEIAFISWTLTDMISDCLGFEITRMYPDDPAANTVLPAWVAFKGQSNPDWLPQNTSVWPVQKLSWKDLTLRKYRNKTERHDSGKRVQYKVRTIVAYSDKLEEVKAPTLNKTYTGTPVRLSYYDEGKLSEVLKITTQFGNVRATFTNGILATEWLAHAMKNPKFGKIKEKIRDKDDDVRKYLTGDVVDTLKMLLEKATAKENATLKMALYELEDEELMEAILAAKDKIEIVLSNTGVDSTRTVWDKENSHNRETLHKEINDKIQVDISHKLTPLFRSKLTPYS